MSGVGAIATFLLCFLRVIVVLAQEYDYVAHIVGSDVHHTPQGDICKAYLNAASRHDAAPPHAFLTEDQLRALKEHIKFDQCLYSKEKLRKKIRRKRRRK